MSSLSARQSYRGALSLVYRLYTEIGRSLRLDFLLALIHPFWGRKVSGEKKIDKSTSPDRSAKYSGILSRNLLRGLGAGLCTIRPSSPKPAFTFLTTWGMGCIMPLHATGLEQSLCSNPSFPSLLSPYSPARARLVTVYYHSCSIGRSSMGEE